MEQMRQSWTDERLDDLNRNVDLRFDQVDLRFDQVDLRFAHVDQRFAHVDRRFDQVEGQLREFRSEMFALRAGVEDRFDSLQRSMFQAAVALSVSLIGVIAALFATQV
jgi:hypothetical protein